MMQVFRSIAGKVAAAVFAVLMIVFLLTSVDWRQVTGGSRTSVGSIDGVTVQLRAYQAMVQQQTENQQRQTGRSLSAEEIEQIRNDVWEQLIQQQALEREYRERHLTVTSDEIAAAIQTSPPNEVLSSPTFQTDGKFDPAKYQRWLRSAEGAQVIPLLEAQYRDEIRRSKLFRVVTADVYVSDPALWQAWQDANEKVTIELVTIDPRRAVPDSAVHLTDADVRKYYDTHRDEFKRPETAYLSYVALLRAPDASDSAAARTRALELRKEIVDGSPFEEVAKRESSDTVSGARGGDLGEFGKGAMDPAFEKAAFSLPIGTVSEPVLSQFGYHLIKVESRTATKVKARHILIPIEITGTHRDQLDARADSLEALGADKLDPAALDTAARVLGLHVGQAQPLQKGGRVQVGLQVIPDAGIWAFQARPGETGRIIELSYAYFLFRLDSLQQEGIPPFEQIKQSVQVAAANDRKKELAKGVAADLTKRIAEGSTLTQAATALGLPHSDLGPFTRINPAIPNPLVVGAAFGIEPGKTSGLIDTEDGMFVLRVIKREPADSAEYQKGIDEFRARQIRLATQDRVRNYLAALRKAAKVTDHRAEIFRTEAQASTDQQRS
ncbi:MAG TPA: peptidyl-prolyl cis-trans isomerase [Gemmatimonadales bacterium]|nr:peptidyl-prolyl cis-trans isomerase [Gemmatimonadales bacterium]